MLYCSEPSCEQSAEERSQLYSELLGKGLEKQDITSTEQRYPDDVMNRLTWIAYMQCKKQNKILITQVLFHSVYIKMLCILICAF